MITRMLYLHHLMGIVTSVN